MGIFRHSGDSETAEVKEKVHAFSQHQQAIIRLFKEKKFWELPALKAVQNSLELVSEEFDAERCSVWTFEQDGTVLQCLDLFERSSHSHSNGTQLKASDFPSYFEAVHESLAVDASDAQNDPRTSEFAEEYLKPLDIVSMLDSAIRQEGNPMGVVCIEQVETLREWTSEDVWFVGQIAEHIERIFIEEAREKERKDLRRSDQRYLAIFNATNDAMMILAADGKILDVNDRTLEMYGVTREQILAADQKDYPVHSSPFSSVEALELIKKTIEGGPQVFEWRAKAPDGRDFWIEVALSSFSMDGEPRIIAALRNITARKKTEEALKKSEERFRFLTSISNEGFIIRDGATIIEANQAFAEIVGAKSPEELIGKNGLHAIPFTPESREIVRNRIANNLDGWDEIELIRPDGTLVYAETGGKDIEYQGKTQRLVYMRNIGERKEARKNQRLYQTLFETAADGIFILGEDFKFVDCNDRTLSMLEISRDEIIGKTPLDFSPEFQPDGKPSMEKALVFNREALNGGNPVFEWKAVTPCGNQLDMEISLLKLPIGDEVRLQAIIRDITERKLAESSLIESEERFKLLVENSSDLVLILNTDSDVLFSGGSSEKILGYSVSEMVGTRALDSAFPDDYVRLKDTLEDVVQNPGVRKRLQWRSKKKGGNWVTLEAVCVNMLDDALVQGILMNVRDVSERVSLSEQLHQATKMEAVGRLAGGVAHDFNNILTAITGNIELAQNGMNSNDPLAKYLDGALKAARSAESLTRQLLAYSRKQIVEPKVLNLNDLVENMQKMLVRIIGEHIDLCVKLDRNAGAVRVDPSQFEQVLVNLTVNARDAMNVDGQLSIETCSVSLSEKLPSSPEIPAGNYAVIKVKDNGHGMSDQVKKHIFDPFFTTKPKGEGTGLGLATIMGIIRQVDGHILVDSEVGKGSTFNIYLPSAGKASATAAKRNAVQDFPGGTETILLVEDEEGVRMVGKIILEKLGYTVLEACNGEEALQIAQQHQYQIDLLLTDVVMPKMNGRELSEKLLEIKPDIKVLFTSGYTEDVILKHGIKRQSLNFITKPYNVQGMANKLRFVLMD